VSHFDVQHRDAFESLAAMRDAGGVDLILTSPPYPDARTDEAYGASFDTSLEGYGKLGDAVFAALRPGGVCALNIDGPVRVWRTDFGQPQHHERVTQSDGRYTERSLISFKVAIDWAERVGFRYVERCSYNVAGCPGAHGPRWRRGFELVHVFARPGGEVFFDGWAHTLPAKTAGLVRSSDTGGRARGVMMSPGVNKAPYGVQRDRRQLDTALKSHAGGNMTDGDHEAPFSRDLADAYVLCYSPPGGLVGDPFVGSGTVAFACHRHDRRFIGGDLGIRHTHKGRPCGRRWADVVNDGLRQTRLFAGSGASGAAP
jgi:hypothetical protein